VIPQIRAEQKHWQEVIQDLQEKGVITHRKQLDELRIWEGSDFNVEGAIYEQLEKERKPVAELLAATRPLKPLVAQRHYTNTGTLRYFEQRYIDSRNRLSELRCSVKSYDGLIAYWMEVDPPKNIPEQTAMENRSLLLARRNWICCACGRKSFKHSKQLRRMLQNY
jgi:hypothetical protein